MSCKHQKITEYLKNKLTLLELRIENFESSMENIAVEQSGCYSVDNSIALCKTSTDCVYWFENINNKYLPLLTALFSTWLYNFDVCSDSDDNAKISIDVTELEDGKNEKLLDLEITLTFCDELFLTEKEDAPIELNGVCYDEGKTVIDTAETGTVKEA